MNSIEIKINECEMSILFELLNQPYHPDKKFEPKFFWKNLRYPDQSGTAQINISRYLKALRQEEIINSNNNLIANNDTALKIKYILNDYKKYNDELRIYFQDNINKNKWDLIEKHNKVLKSIITFFDNFENEFKGEHSNYSYFKYTSTIKPTKEEFKKMVWTRYHLKHNSTVNKILRNIFIG